jgi:hypothetical protein
VKTSCFCKFCLPSAGIVDVNHQAQLIFKLLTHSKIFIETHHLILTSNVPGNRVEMMARTDSLMDIMDSVAMA